MIGARTTSKTILHGDQMRVRAKAIIASTLYGIWCRVSGGRTGTREAWAKEDGQILAFSDFKKAKETADSYNKSMNGPNSTASFEYSVKELPTHLHNECKVAKRAASVVTIRGWEVMDKSFITKGPDPTEMEVYVLSNGRTTWELEQFFGDWKAKKNGVPVQFSGNKEKLDEMLSYD